MNKTQWKIEIWKVLHIVRKQMVRRRKNDNKGSRRETETEREGDGE